MPEGNKARKAVAIVKAKKAKLKSQKSSRDYIKEGMQEGGGVKVRDDVANSQTERLSRAANHKEANRNVIEGMMEGGIIIPMQVGGGTATTTMGNPIVSPTPTPTPSPSPPVGPLGNSAGPPTTPVPGSVATGAPVPQDVADMQGIGKVFDKYGEPGIQALILGLASARKIHRAALAQPPNPNTGPADIPDFRSLMVQEVTRAMAALLGPQAVQMPVVPIGTQTPTPAHTTPAYP